jgi:hypothetical protein
MRRVLSGVFSSAALAVLAIVSLLWSMFADPTTEAGLLLLGALNTGAALLTLAWAGGSPEPRPERPVDRHPVGLGVG